VFIDLLALKRIFPRLPLEPDDNRIAATEEQTNVLLRAGIRDAQITHALADRILRVISSRKKAGLCTIKRAQLMLHLGYENPAAATFHDAREWLDQNASNRKKGGGRKMLYAIVEGAKSRAAPNSKGICSGCLGAVIPKCGQIKVWHFAHARGIDCDPWHEGESAWHLEWKALFPKECVEIPLGEHRADVFFDSGDPFVDSTTIEFQNSPINPEEIQEREEFYRERGRLIWIFNAAKWHLSLRHKFDPHPRYRSFRWKWPHLSLAACRSYPLFFDLGDGWLL
jgi:hypothetical protein